MDPQSARLARALSVSLALHAAVLAFARPDLARQGIGLPAGGRLDARLIPVAAAATIGSALPTLAEDASRRPAKRLPEPPEPTAGADRQAGEPEPGAGKYIPANLLTRPAVPEQLRELMPPQLRDEPGSGTLILDVLVNAGGGVDAISVVATEVPGPFLAHILGAFYAARFRPGELLGRPVPAAVRIEIVVPPSEQRAHGGRGVRIVPPPAAIPATAATP